MALTERGAAMSEAEVAHLALDAAWVEVTAAADALAVGDLCQQRGAPRWQSLRA
jgi:hypothetical protein